jgi:NAD-dependent deacetylase
MIKNIVVLTGAGVSAESGIETFRDGNGLWAKHDVRTVASVDGWNENSGLVLGFYNKRRNEISNTAPNKAHVALARLEQLFDVAIVTQNIDDLHERSGSSNVVHLHGMITQARSVNINSQDVYDIGYSDLNLGDCGVDGFQLRPNIVWFGEEVPLFGYAAQLVENADILIVVGTSLQVFPAASLLHYKKGISPCYYIDPNAENNGITNMSLNKSVATTGVPHLVNYLINEEKRHINK